MRRFLTICVAAGLVALGWTAGRAAAQAQRADFEITVSSPVGETTITCTRGCGLQFIRMTPDKSAAQPSFTYRCGGGGAERCGGAVQGWVVP